MAVIDRFVARTAKSPTSGCVEWQGGFDKDGYGKTWHAGKTVRAHRLSHLLFVGSIPVGMQVLHSCDNPICVTPTHLKIGTNHDNVLDMHSKQRHVKNVGGDHGMAKLTEGQVSTIRASYVPRKVSMRKLAKRFGVSYSAIHLVLNGTNWKHSNRKESV